jgi:hypothetical protein
VTPLWTYPEGHEPEWLDWSAHSARDPQLRIMELQAELRNNAVEVWFLRALCLVLAVALALALVMGLA